LKVGFRFTKHAENEIIGIAGLGLRQSGPAQARCS